MTAYLIFLGKLFKFLYLFAFLQLELVFITKKQMRNVGAKKSRMRETQIRCPLIHGLPKHTCGLMDILLNNS
jgi:hypothetical protein